MKTRILLEAIPTILIAGGIFLAIPTGLYISLGIFVALILAVIFGQYKEHMLVTKAPSWTYAGTFLVDSILWGPAIARQIISQFIKDDDKTTS